MEYRYYQSPTPAFHHSYGFDREMRVKRTAEIEERTNRILQSNATLFNLMKKAEIRMEDQLSITEDWRTSAGGSRNDKPAALIKQEYVPLNKMHDWPWQTKTESQNIGWFADPQREPGCRFRQIPMHYSFV